MFGRSPQVVVVLLTAALGCQASGAGSASSDSRDSSAAGEARFPDALDRSDAGAESPPPQNTGRCTAERAITQIFYSGDSTPPLAGPRVDIRRQDGQTLMLRYGASGPDVSWWTDDDGLASYSRAEVVDRTRRTREFSGPVLTWPG